MISTTWTMISSLDTITSRSTMDPDHLHPWLAFIPAVRLPTIPTPRSPRPRIANINNNNKGMLAPDTSRHCPILLICRRTKGQCLLHLDLFLLLLPRLSRAASNMDRHPPPLSQNHNTPNIHNNISISNNNTKEGNNAERSMPAIKAPLIFCQVSPKGEPRCICMRRRMSIPSIMHQK